MHPIPRSAELPGAAQGEETNKLSRRRSGRTRKPAAVPSRRRAGSKKRKTGKTAARGTRTAEPASPPPAPRPGTKVAQVLERLRQPGGATLEEITGVTGWQPHSVRGFLSGALGKKRGLTVVSSKGDDGIRRYSISI
jgi:Protein of unknown function (DUF3489)